MPFVYPNSAPVLPVARVAYQPGAPLQRLAGPGRFGRVRLPRRLQGSPNLFSSFSDVFGLPSTITGAAGSSAAPSSNAVAASSPWSALASALQKTAANFVPASTSPAASTPITTPPPSNTNTNPYSKATGLSGWWKSPSPIYKSWTNGEIALTGLGLVGLALGISSARKRGRG